MLLTKQALEGIDSKILTLLIHTMGFQSLVLIALKAMTITDMLQRI